MKNCVKRLCLIIGISIIFVVVGQIVLFANNKTDGCNSLQEDPGSIRNNLTVHKSGQNIVINWTMCTCCCIVEAHSIYEGSLPFLGYNHVPLVCHIVGPPYSIPDDGLNHYYLATVEALGYEGSYGADSEGNKIPQSTNPCLPQQFGC